MYILNDIVKFDFVGNFFSIYLSDQVIINICIDSVVEFILFKRLNVLNVWIFGYDDGVC